MSDVSLMHFRQAELDREEWQMYFFSTRNEQIKVNSAQAIVQGLSEEGGLFVPAEFPKVSLDELLKWEDYPTTAAKILELFLTDYDPDFIQKAVHETYTAQAFGGKAGYVASLSSTLFALELWHGPTSAFKDYALQLMPKLLVEAKKMLHISETTHVLVATSGDTGKAALEGYQDLDGIEISVFYPSNGTSEIQRLQMSTQKGKNVHVYAVKGNFDDAQSGVKRIFSNKNLANTLREQDVALSSANSINWGRLVPQIVYYFYSYKQLVEHYGLTLGQKVDFCVPTGNFGDILAGYYAKQMGLPVGRLICASNQNKVLEEFLRTGRYDARRTFYRTSSPSMDILVSSNLERLLYHVTKDTQKVRQWMEELRKDGFYQVDENTLKSIQETFVGGWANETEVAEELKRIYETYGYLCDTHTAVAFFVANKHRSEHTMVVLSTASPYKFPKDVLKSLGEQVPSNDFAAMEKLQACTNTEAPKNLSELNQLPERFHQVIEPQEMEQVVLQ